MCFYSSWIYYFRRCRCQRRCEAASLERGEPFVSLRHPTAVSRYGVGSCCAWPRACAAMTIENVAPLTASDADADAMPKVLLGVACSRNQAPYLNGFLRHIRACWRAPISIRFSVRCPMCAFSGCGGMVCAARHDNKRSHTMPRHGANTRRVRHGPLLTTGLSMARGVLSQRSNAEHTRVSIDVVPP